MTAKMTNLVTKLTSMLNGEWAGSPAWPVDQKEANMLISRKLALLFAAAMIYPSTANAATFVFNGTLTGSQEVPPVSTPGSGTAFVTFDDVTNLLSIQATFTNLLGTTRMAHIHCCAPIGANAGVVTPVPSFPGFPLGVTAGSYSQVFDLTQVSSFNPAFITNNGGSVTTARQAFITGLQLNRAYFNIHTSQFPGGEIRGQLIAAVPEPATWSLMLLGFGAIGATMRRRKVTSRVKYAF